MRAFGTAALLLAMAGILWPISAPSEDAETGITITTESDNGSQVAVDGIVCDNLRDTPTGQKNRLDIQLSAAFAQQDVSGTVANPDATAADADRHNNVGTISGGKGRLVYYPPDEFNRRQEPGRLHDVDGPSTRTVLLTVRARASDGAVTTFTPIPIVLARPPVVLIHGINRGPRSWVAFARAVALLHSERGRNIEIPLTTLDHFAPSSYSGANFRDRSRYPEGLFSGSGPVEIGADLLARHIRDTRRRVLAGEPIAFMDASQAVDAPAEFAYRFPDRNAGPPPRLAIRRVDVLGWSYGGVIARWYLDAHGDRPPAQTYGYHGGYGLAGPDGRPINLYPSVEYQHDVRKLITLGSMWRGVPLSNYLNEIRFSRPEDPNSLARAPVRLPHWMPRSLWKQIGAERTVGSLANAIDARIRVKTPAMEVMAVNSPWMAALIYGATALGRNRVASPFRDDVAYGSIAGDDSAYLAFGPLSSISPYGTLPYFQQPARFPYLALERRAGLAGTLSPVIGGRHDYSDGMVPIWSAVIPGNVPGASRIVHATHETFFTDRETLDYTVRWLNNAALPTGRVLRPQWDSDVVSRDGRKRWEFRAGEMAPVGRNALYVCADGIGRIGPTALHPEQGLVIHRDSDQTVRVEWKLPAGGRLREVTLYLRKEVSKNGGQDHLERVGAATADGDPSAPRVIVEGLQRGPSYFIVAEATVDNYPDPPVIVKSKLMLVPPP